MNLNDLENSNKFFEEGNKKYDAENLQDALSYYTKSIYFNPNNVDAFFNRGCVRKELQDFFDQLNTEQFDKIQKFFDEMPKLRHTIKVKNPNTGVESDIVLEGLQSFLGQPFHMTVWETTTRPTLL